jgi:hypothetical protein
MVPVGFLMVPVGFLGFLKFWVGLTYEITYFRKIKLLLRNKF